MRHFLKGGHTCAQLSPFLLFCKQDWSAHQQGNFGRPFSHHTDSAHVGEETSTVLRQNWLSRFTATVLKIWCQTDSQLKSQLGRNLHLLFCSQIEAESKIQDFFMLPRNSTHKNSSLKIPCFALVDISQFTAANTRHIS